MLSTLILNCPHLPDNMANTSILIKFTNLELYESDFTDLSNIGITIQGVLFSHLLYHFVLTYLNWENGTICNSESFESISTGLQNASRNFIEPADCGNQVLTKNWRNFEMEKHFFNQVFE